MMPKLLFLTVLVFGGFFILKPMLAGRSTPEKFHLILGLVFFLPGFMVLLLGIFISPSGYLIFCGALCSIIGLAILVPIFQKIGTWLHLRKCGVRCEAVVTSLEEDEHLGVWENYSFSIPFFYNKYMHKEYHPNCYISEGDGHRFSFYFPPAWRQPELMQGLHMTVVYDPAKPSRYYVVRRSVRKAWKEKRQS